MSVPSVIDELVTVPEAAKMLRVSQGSVRMWLKLRKLERTKVGRRTLLTRTELARFVASSNPKPALTPGKNGEKLADAA